LRDAVIRATKLLELIRKQKNRFRLSTDSRLSFTPHQEWWPLMDELAELLRAIREIPVPEGDQLEP